MRNVILLSAVSIDGYIAKVDGSLDWLYHFDKENNEETELFDQFFDSIDTTLLGRKTYTSIANYGNKDPFPGKENYIFSRNAIPNIENATVVNPDLVPFIVGLKKEKKKDIWLVGGGELNSSFLQNDLIDVLRLSIIPIVLGSGIPLFKKETQYVQYKIDTIQKFKSGRLHVQYSRKNNA